jgi:hypothetical protein
MRRILIAALFGAPLLIAGPAAAAIAGGETSAKAVGQQGLASDLTHELIAGTTLDELIPETPAEPRGVQLAGDSNAGALWWLQLGVGNRWHDRDYRRHNHRRWDHDRRWRREHGGHWNQRRWWYERNQRRHGHDWRRHRDWDHDDRRWRRHRDRDDDHRWRSRRDWDDDDHRRHRGRHDWDDHDHDYRSAEGRRHR